MRVYHNTFVDTAASFERNERSAVAGLKSTSYAENVVALFFFLVPGLFLGMSHNVACLHSWADAMVRPYVVEGKVTTEYANQSLPGLKAVAQDGRTFARELWKVVIGGAKDQYQKLVTISPAPGPEAGAEVRLRLTGGVRYPAGR